MKKKDKKKTNEFIWQPKIWKKHFTAIYHSGPKNLIKRLPCYIQCNNCVSFCVMFLFLNLQMKWLKAKYFSIQILLNAGDKEIEHRVGCARDSFTQRHKLLQNPNINLKTRHVLKYPHQIETTYGCYAWHETRSEISKILAVYNRFLISVVKNGF